MDNRYTVISSSNTYSTVSYYLYPDFEVILDTDKDSIADEIEIQIAEKFKPVLHKHSYDLQQGLQNFENLLIDGEFTLKVYNDISQQVYNQVVSGSEDALHKWNLWHWDTYGRGSISNSESYNLDLYNSFRYSGASYGQRPIYYHVYKDNNYYYIQYWYYFGMNDISAQTGTWHESDWEHVSIRLTANGSLFVPDSINFYIHEGGKSYSASQCWWTPDNSLSYSGIQQGYDENHTHLHIWLAANSHASYNRYSQVFNLEFNILGSVYTETYIDRLDYEPASYDVYFEYDQLIKLGEVTKETSVECPVSGYTLAFHSYPLGPGTKHWLAYRGRLGNFNHSGSPFMPAKNPSNPSHEWTEFSVSDEFGNDDTYEWVKTMHIWWTNDGVTGD